MGSWELRYDRDGNPVLVGTADGYETRLRLVDGKFEIRFDDGLELKDECPPPTLARLMVSTEQGRAAMRDALASSGDAVVFTTGRQHGKSEVMRQSAAEYLRAAGWTLVPPNETSLPACKSCGGTGEILDHAVDNFYPVYRYCACPFGTFRRLLECDDPDGILEGDELKLWHEVHHKPAQSRGEGAEPRPVAVEVETVNVGAQRVEVDSKTFAKLERKLARIRTRKAARHG